MLTAVIAVANVVVGLMLLALDHKQEIDALRFFLRLCGLIQMILGCSVSFYLLLGESFQPYQLIYHLINLFAGIALLEFIGRRNWPADR